MRITNVGKRCVRRLRGLTTPHALWLALFLIAPVFVQAQQDQGTAGGRGQRRRPAAPTPAEVALARQAAYPLTGDDSDYEPLMEAIGDARLVLLGEATHGTHEFYRERARITRRLVEEKGFNVVVLEADWPLAYRVNEYVRGLRDGETVREVLAAFNRFPQWVWRNRDFADFVEWLRAYNDSRPRGAARVGVYGMDLYSLADSAEAVVRYLERVHPEAAREARKSYNCLKGYRNRPEQYGYDVVRQRKSPCEKKVAAQLVEMERRYAAWLAQPERTRGDDLLSAYQNVRAVRAGEVYYRLSSFPQFSTWNLRDSHMADTIEELVRYVDALGGEKAKVVVWAHNTHQGDARMTERGEHGEHSVGHLLRQSHGAQTFLLGFTTYAGEVMAAPARGWSGRRMKVRPAIKESHSALFHQTGIPNFLLLFRGDERLSEALGVRRPERAIGVVYTTETERKSHYFEAQISRQFDAVIHWDVTSAVEPLK